MEREEGRERTISPLANNHRKDKKRRIHNFWMLNTMPCIFIIFICVVYICKQHAYEEQTSISIFRIKFKFIFLRCCCCCSFVFPGHRAYGNDPYSLSKLKNVFSDDNTGGMAAAANSKQCINILIFNRRWDIHSDIRMCFLSTWGY